MKNFIYFFSIVISIKVSAQNPVCYESFGSPSLTTQVNTYQGYDQKTPVVYSGSADVRNTTPSSSYSDASGGGNVFFANNPGKYLLISGINTYGYSSLRLSFGHYKSTTAASSELIVEISTDSINYTPLSYSRPTGAGTTGWMRITAEGTMPSAENIFIRFTQTSATSQFRIDDIHISGILDGCPPPAIQAGNVIFSNVMDTTATISWDNGSGAGRIVKLNTVPNFSKPIHKISPVSSNTYNGGEQVIYNKADFGSSVTINGLKSGTTYYTAVYEYCIPDQNYHVDPVIATVQTACYKPELAVDLKGSIANEKSKLSWKSGKCTDEFLMIASLNSIPVSFIPSGDGNYLMADSIFENGTEVSPGCYAVYKGSLNNVEVRGLTNDSTYRFSLFSRYDNFWTGPISVTLTPEYPSNGLLIRELDKLVVVNFDQTVEGVNNHQFLGLGLKSEPDAGFLDSDAWRISGMSDGTAGFGGDYDSGDFAAGYSSVGVSTSGLWAFQVSPGTENVALGFQPTGNDFTPGTITLKVKNKTNQTVNTIYLSYHIYCNDNGGRSSAIKCSYAPDSNLLFIGLDQLDYASRYSANSALATQVNWVKNYREAEITNLNVAPGGSFYLRWTTDDMPGGAGNRDELALDDIVLVANPSESRISLVEGVYESLVAGKNTWVKDPLVITRKLDIPPNCTLSLAENVALHTVDILNNGLLTLENGASIIPDTSYSQSGTGQYLVKRAKPNGQPNFYCNFWSSPVDSGHTSMLRNGFEIYKFDPGEDETSAYYPFTGFILPAEGVVARGVDTALFYGTANNGNIALPLVYNPSSQGSSNLVGNPYPSALNAEKFVNANASLLENGVVYIWSQVNESAFVISEDFIAVSALGSPDYQRDLDLATTNIASCQSFFVNASANGNLCFANDMRNGENSFFKSGDLNRFWLRIHNSKRYASTLIGLNADASFGNDFKFDAPSMPGSTLAINSVIQGKSYCIQGLPFPASDTVLPLYVHIDSAGDYSIDIPRIDNRSGFSNITLHDRLLNREIDLLKGSWFFTELNPNSTYYDRFYLSFKKSSVEITMPELPANITYTFEDSQLEVRSSRTIDYIEVFNSSGELILRGSPKAEVCSTFIKEHGVILVVIGAHGFRESFKILNP